MVEPTAASAITFAPHVRPTKPWLMQFALVLRTRKRCYWSWNPVDLVRLTDCSEIQQIVNVPRCSQYISLYFECCLSNAVFMYFECCLHFMYRGVRYGSYRENCQPL